MAESITLREARSQEAIQLSALALRSKAHWDYTPEFIESCREELTYDPRQFRDDRQHFVVAETSTNIAGFYAMQQFSKQAYELVALFVEPEFIGKGIGRTLMRHALRAVAARGGKTVLIQGDPNAEKFYLAAGATKVGERESGSIPGRFLPLFEIRVQPIREGLA